MKGGEAECFGLVAGVNKSNWSGRFVYSCNKVG